MGKEKPQTVVVPLSGIGPLSFQVSPGMTLTVRELSSPSKNRPDGRGQLQIPKLFGFQRNYESWEPRCRSARKNRASSSAVLQGG
jgi:hypothetical protein